MAEASVPVDLTNPGQVFACLGFLEAANVLLGNARGGFAWTDPDDVRFHLAAGTNDHPIEQVLRFLKEAKVTSFAPPGSLHTTQKWKIETETEDSRVFPFRDSGPGVLPARLSNGSGRSIVIDYWGDQGQVGRDKVKFWAGAGGYPGARLARDALDLIRGRVADYVDDPFSLSAEQSNSFRFDWRRDYVPIDAGFSPNAHRNTVIMRGYPLVELLAAIGLTNARPIRHARMRYSYGVAGLVGDDLYDPIFLRAALGSKNQPVPGMLFRLFTMQLDSPEEKGRIRCITEVIEETSSS